MKFHRLGSFTLIFLLLFTSVMPAGAQTITTGDITGTVTDSSAAIVPNATVTLKDAATGETRTTKTNQSGVFRFSLLKPSTYTVSASGNGLQSGSVKSAVSVGQVVTVDLTATPTGSETTIEVSASAPLLQTNDANLTTNYDARQIALLPNAGGDVTSLAYTAPGVVVSTGAGYGNFSSHGLPGTSNLFTVNGNDNMDPYLNLNNSGASNLSLGSSEMQETAVVQNGYSAQYGRQAGAQVNYTTKSGSNQFHGGMQYWWNGSVLNANDYFNNQNDVPRGRANSNQWAAQLGGPIVKNKTFFFVDTEGLRYILPSSGVVTTPSPQLQSYILANAPAAARPFYQQMFGLYNGADGISRAVPVTNGDGALQDTAGNLGCGGLAGTPTTGGTFGVDVPCAMAFGTNVTNQNKEWLLSTRIDHKISDRQNLFGRFKMDRGLQPTYTDPINPAFSAESNQPSYEGQLNHTWILSPTVVNNFIASGSYYSAIFGPKDLNAALNLLPVQVDLFDGGSNGAGGFTPLGVPLASYPQGRRVAQYQLVDDLSMTRGSHSFKMGANFRRNNVADTGLQVLTRGGQYRIFDLSEYANASFSSGISSYRQRFASFDQAHIALYSLGVYLQDEWSVKSNLKLTMALRVDRNANPTCRDNCFTRLNSDFSSLAKGANIPYNQSITTGLDQAFSQIEALSFQPRFGFNWSPFNSQTTVIRGGIGMFSDLFPGNIAGQVYNNSPNVFTPSILQADILASGATSGPGVAAATNSAFRNGFANGFTAAQIQAALNPVPFTQPGFTALPEKVLNPKYLQWNLEVQRSLGAKTSVSVNYVGNHGYDLFILDGKVNSFDKNQAGFGGLPSVAPDPRFRVVTQLSNTGVSNYNGLTFALNRQFSHGFQGQVSYTWSHALDDVSNGGLTEYYSFQDSIQGQLDPLNLSRLNYSNADYDIRHNLTASYVWELPMKFQSAPVNHLLGGWSFSGKVYVRTSTPFSVYNSRLAAAISNSTGGTVLANYLGTSIPDCSSVSTPCFTASDFSTTASQTGFGNLPRNSFRGPGYFNTDFSVYKKIVSLERMNFSIGANMYNAFNHANFANPGEDVSSSGLGQISSTVTPPSSPYGSFQGSAVSGRVVQLTGKLTF